MNEIIKASEGMMLTNGEAYANVVRLGSGDSVDNWHEIPIEEYKAKLEEIDKEV